MKSNFNQYSIGGFESPKESKISLGTRGIFIQEMSKESTPSYKVDVVSGLKSLNGNQVGAWHTQMRGQDNVSPNLSQAENRTLRASGEQMPGERELNKFQL